jgi:hypothetical protein
VIVSLLLFTVFTIYINGAFVDKTYERLSHIACEKREFCLLEVVFEIGVKSETLSVLEK